MLFSWRRIRLPAATPLRFSLTIGATAAVKLAEVAVLIYSAFETRVAVIDLRSARLPARLDAGQQWTTEAPSRM